MSRGQGIAYIAYLFKISGKLQKLVYPFTDLGNNISSTVSNVNIRLIKGVDGY